MNSGTLLGSLIFAVIVVLAITLLIWLVLRGWHRRAQRQAELIGTLPALPDTVSAPILPAMKGLYVGSTIAPSWQDRIAAADLGYRSKSVLTRYPEGIMLQRSGTHPIWIPQESITAIRTERGIAGKALSYDGILAIRWTLPSGTEIDTGFRADDRGQYENWTAGGAAPQEGLM